MAELPTPEENGLAILAFYRKHNVRPGEMLPFANLNIHWLKANKRSEDLGAGLEWLIAQGYLEEKPEKDKMFFLTEKGFAKM